jgi:hypothetical protein
MHEQINRHRRRFLSLAAVTVAGARLGARGAERVQSVRTKMFRELQQIRCRRPEHRLCGSRSVHRSRSGTSSRLAL